MRNVDIKNQIWFMQDGAVTRIGLTQSFINSLDECWQILPANTREFKKKSPLFTVETNDALISIMSPINGHLNMFNTTARDFPDHLTEDMVIMELTSNEQPAANFARRPAVVQARAAQFIGGVDGAAVADFEFAPARMRGGNAPAGAAPQPLHPGFENPVENRRQGVLAEIRANLRGGYVPAPGQVLFDDGEL
jgi:glycine cleavage system H lipoate-binding protein